MVEDCLPEKLRIRWEDETIATKTVPSVDRLIDFFRERATQPQYDDKVSSTTPAFERKPSSKQRNPGHQGRANPTRLNPLLTFPVGTLVQSAARHTMPMPVTSSKRRPLPRRKNMLGLTLSVLGASSQGTAYRNAETGTTVGSVREIIMPCSTHQTEATAALLQPQGLSTQPVQPPQQAASSRTNF